jgi:tetratricopeptide (TPR) repeat protein
MSLDPYSLCPCGSGKKFKFCCVDLAEPMEKVHRHREHHQPRMALQVLDRIEKKHATNPWALIERASIHLDEGDANAAKAALEQLRENEPNHELAIVLHAIAVFDADGFDEAKSFIYEAFLKCANTHFEMLSGLALSIASLMAAAQRHMAARQFLTLAMRLAPQERQQEIFLELLRFDSSSDFPYPLRSVHQLVPYTGAADLKSQADEAERLAELGCCEPAAEVFTRLGEEQPDCAVFWQNAGICRAWAGDEQSAADALHLAAQLHDDFDTAVELETMAQLLDLTHTEDVVRFGQAEYRVQSASKLLSQFSDHARIISLPLPPKQEGQSDDEQPIGFLHVIDRDVPAESDVGSLTLETIPNVEADISVFDGDPRKDQPAMAFISGLEGERFDAAKKLFEETAGDNVEVVTPPDGDEEFSGTRSIPSQLRLLHWQWHSPAKTPGVLVENLEQQKWREVIEEGWVNQPQEALRGKSPREAMDDEELRLRLTASVYALDALCDRNNNALDVEGLCNRLNLKSASPISVTDETQLNAFSAMQLNRLSVKELNDEQLNLALNRSLLLHHSRFLYEVLIEALGRPSCAEQINRERAYMSLVELCKAQFRREEAIEWVKKGGELEGDGANAFQQQVIWKLRELTIRLDDPDDPELNPLLELLYTRYASKLPELGDQLDELCETRGIKAPWRDAASIITSATAPAGGDWNPDSGAEPSGGEKKLWLPGQ